MKTFLKLNNISAYKKALNLSNYVWDVVFRWDRFAQDTVGKQFVRSVDSISANIAEGFGRYTKKDKTKLLPYKFWVNKRIFRLEREGKSKKASLKRTL